MHATHQVPMRWADLDMLRHVNNVVYVEYAAQVRSELERAGRLPAGRVPSEVVADFHRPVPLDLLRPVEVDTTADGDRLVQVVRAPGSDAPAATVTTSFAPAEPLVPREGERVVLPLAMRASDATSGRVGPTRAFELFQEARIAALGRLLEGEWGGTIVVASMRLQLAGPIAWSPEPLQMATGVVRLGTSSFHVESDLLTADGVTARATAALVGFDAETQRAAPLRESMRDRLAAAVVR